MTWQPELDEIRRRQALARTMGGAEKVDKHHAQGRLTVRERIAALLDPGTFDEVGSLAGAATYDEQGRLTNFVPANFVSGTGRIDGRKVVVGGDDFTVRGGAADASIWEKQVHSEKLAHGLRVPLVRLVDGTGGGGSVKLLERLGFAYVPVNPGWDYVVANMSLIPVVGACMGSVAGLGAARVAAAHCSLMVAATSQLFVAGPPVVKAGMGEDLTKDELGGVGIHATSGAVDLVVGSEAEAFAAIRRFLSYLPPNVFELPPVLPPGDPPDRREAALLSAIPRDERRPFRIRPILAAIFDVDSVFELARYGGATVTALARLDGHPVGVVSADPYQGGGGLTAEGADAVIRLVDLCQTFHLPLVALTDQPGLAIGLAAERRGTIRAGVRAVAAIYQASVPAAEVILRRVFGVGGAGMTNRHGFVRRWAWPSASWGSLPVAGGLEAAYRRELEASDDPGGADGTHSRAARGGAFAAALGGAFPDRGVDRSARDASAALRVGARRLRAAAVADRPPILRHAAVASEKEIAMRAVLCRAYGPPDQLRDRRSAVADPRRRAGAGRGPRLRRELPRYAHYPGQISVSAAAALYRQAATSRAWCRRRRWGDGRARRRPGDGLHRRGRRRLRRGGRLRRAEPRPTAAKRRLHHWRRVWPDLFSTSYHALKDRAHLRSGETLLVLGAAGGVGLAAVELGKLLGARVLAAASNGAKLAVCRAYGADETIDYSAEDLRERIKTLTAGRGVDVVYDPVGGAFAEPALRGMAWEGRYLVVGFAAGEIPRIPLNLPLLKGCAIVGVFLGRLRPA